MSFVMISRLVKIQFGHEKIPQNCKEVAERIDEDEQ